MALLRLFFIIVLFHLMGFTWPFSWLTGNSNSAPFGSNEWVETEKRLLLSQADNIDSDVLKLGLTAYSNAKKNGLDYKKLLTIIDYSKPSYERRLWVFDLKRNKVLFNTWVSHGQNSGGTSAISFSNSVGSKKSSLGLFLTDWEPYSGGNGVSLRMRGLEYGYNDNAYRRNVVIHGAWYVHPDIIKKYGQLGRSWGCPAVSESQIKPLIDTIKENTLVFVYYPDRQWMKNSKFLATA